jgi:hypothetical protein
MVLKNFSNKPSATGSLEQSAASVCDEYNTHKINHVNSDASKRLQKEGSMRHMLENLNISHDLKKKLVTLLGN